jgi:hypothetical protein
VVVTGSGDPPVVTREPDVVAQPAIATTAATHLAQRRSNGLDGDVRTMGLDVGNGCPVPKLPG